MYIYGTISTAQRKAHKHRHTLTHTHTHTHTHTMTAIEYAVAFMQVYKTKFYFA